MAEMRTNLADWERWASLLGGTLLATRALRRPTFASALLAGLGVALIGRGLGGYCPIYKRFGIDGRQPLGRTPLRPHRDRDVDRTSDDSFPASDPPSWTPTTIGAPDEAA